MGFNGIYSLGHEMSPLNINPPLGINGLLDGYYKVMSNIPKMGHLPTPVECSKNGFEKMFS